MLTEATPLEMRWLSSLAEINRPAWQEFARPDELTTDLAYLQAVEASQAVPCEPGYLEFYRQNQFVCALAGYLVDNNLADILAGRAGGLLRALQRFQPTLFHLRTFEIGCPISTGLPVVLSPEASLADLEAALLLTQRSLRRRAAVLLMRDFYGPLHPLEIVAERQGWQRMVGYPLAELRLPWDSYDAYLAALRKRYRYDQRDKTRRKEAAGIRTVVTTEAGPPAQTQVYEALYRNVHERSSEYPREFIGTPYHQAMERYLHGRSIWFQYYHEDTLVAFTHVIMTGDQLHLQYLGMDYQFSHQAALYFNFFYDVIRLAFTCGLRIVRAGVTTYSVKSSIGFSVLPQRMYLWHPLPLARRLAERFFTSTTDFELDRCRLVFREPQYQVLWDGKTVDQYYA